MPGNHLGHMLPGHAHVHGQMFVNNQISTSVLRANQQASLRMQGNVSSGLQGGAGSTMPTSSIPTHHGQLLHSQQMQTMQQSLSQQQQQQQHSMSMQSAAAAAAVAASQMAQAQAQAHMVGHMANMHAMQGANGSALAAAAGAMAAGQGAAGQGAMADPSSANAIGGKGSGKKGAKGASAGGAKGAGSGGAAGGGAEGFQLKKRKKGGKD